MRRRLVYAGVASAFLVAPLAQGSASHALGTARSAQTPDQQLVAALTTVRDAARTASSQLAQPSAARVTRARTEIQRSIGAAVLAVKVAKSAVGALETPSVREALTRSPVLTRQARAHLAGGRYSGVRTRLLRTIALTGDALADFGRPLVKQFPSFAVNRDFAYLPAFANYSGFSARVGKEVTEVVVGAADRTTANLGEPGVTPYQSGGLPITQMSVAVVSDPIGRFSSGWCELEAGMITCSIRPAMPTSHVFTIAFGPKLPPGTKLLVKFRTASGERSYAVFTTR